MAFDNLVNAVSALPSSEGVKERSPDELATKIRRVKVAYTEFFRCGAQTAIEEWLNK